MPKLPHEALVQLVRRAPEIILSLLWPDGPPPSCTTIHVTAGEFVDLNFAEYHADVVLALGGVPGRPEGVVVVEAQNSIDPAKRESWPVYISGVRSRLHCPCALVILAPDRRVAAWCSTPIDLGWGRFVQHPWVIGPDDIPVITELERARAAPELAVLSVAAHADEPVALAVALTAAEAARDLDDGRSVRYIDFIFGLLGPQARTLLEQLMSTAERRYFSDIFQEHFDRGLAEGEAKGEAKGKAEGKAELLLKLLALKNFTLTEADRQRILGCAEPDRLDAWAGRVLTANCLDDVLRPD